MTDIATWLGQQLDEDAMWAREASRDNHGYVPTGSHWQWVNNHDDRVLAPDPATEEWLDENSEAGQPALRSVEEFDTTSSYTLPQFPIHNAEEIRSAVAGHIARHDPARVLRVVTALYAILAEHPTVYRDLGWLENGEERSAELPVCGHCVPKNSYYPKPEDVPRGPCQTVRAVAVIYDDRPGYENEWRP